MQSKPEKIRSSAAGIAQQYVEHAGMGGTVTWSREQLEQQWGPMVRAARGVTGNREEAEECAAQALLQVLERQPADVANLQAFMVTVAKRRGLDRLRMLERIRIRDSRLEGLAEHSIADVAENVVARAEACWIDQQARELLRPQVYALLQMIADGRTMSESARALSISERAAQSHLHRARTLLRATLANALAAIAVLGLRLKRSAAASASMTLAATALLLIPAHLGGGAMDTPGPSEAPTVGIVMVSPVDSAASGRAGRPVLAGVAGRRAPVGQPTSVPAQRNTRPLLKVREPLGATTRVREDRHGSGPPAGPVGTVTECLNNLELTAQHVGC
jgi:DNA-directed RNA polymerase specialized sigma24 family protein